MNGRRRGWWALGLFWGAVLAIAGLGAATLAWLGPPRPVAPARPAAPAILRGNNTPWPGPPPRQAGGAIPPPDPALLEPAPDFPGFQLPRIGPGGRTPAAAYAANANPADPRGKIALVVAGIGLDQSDSLAAIRTLPAAIDLAVSPEAADPAPLLRAARAAGHETLLSLPMEPDGYPANDEGAHELLTTATPAQNARNLEWALSRIAGYAGVTGASGGQRGERVGGSPGLMALVARELDARGLFYLDPRPDAPPPPGLASRVVAIAIDSEAEGDAINRQLAALEQAARGRGGAIGLVGRPSPIAVARIAAWASGLAGRGMVLVPVSVRPS